MAITHFQKEALHTLINLTSELHTEDLSAKAIAFNQILDMAEEGNSDAMFQVSRCLRQGWGVKLNEDQGDYWLRRACATLPASSHALFVLGMQHYLQQRPQANPEQGLTMIRQAAEMGLPIAVVKMAEVYENGALASKPNLRQGYRLLASHASNNGDPAIMAAYLKFIVTHAPIKQFLDS